MPIADTTTTMDWEGGTIGAIVPALMGHGEAGRASPWPFSYAPRVNLKICFRKCSYCRFESESVCEPRHAASARAKWPGPDTPIAKRSKSKTDEKLVDLVASVIPSDRIVTCDDVCGLLKAADPEREFNLPTIRTTLHRLNREGTIKKVNHPQADKKVGFCLPQFDAEEVRPLADWTE